MRSIILCSLVFFLVQFAAWSNGDTVQVEQRLLQKVNDFIQKVMDAQHGAPWGSARSGYGCEEDGCPGSCATAWWARLMDLHGREQ